MKGSKKSSKRGKQKHVVVDKNNEEGMPQSFGKVSFCAIRHAQTSFIPYLRVERTMEKRKRVKSSKLGKLPKLNGYKRRRQ